MNQAAMRQLRKALDEGNLEEAKAAMIELERGEKAQPAAEDFTPGGEATKERERIEGEDNGHGEQEL